MTCIAKLLSIFFPNLCRFSYYMSLRTPCTGYGKSFRSKVVAQQPCQRQCPGPCLALLWEAVWARLPPTLAPAAPLPKLGPRLRSVSMPSNSWLTRVCWTPTPTPAPGPGNVGEGANSAPVHGVCCVICPNFVQSCDLSWLCLVLTMCLVLTVLFWLCPYCFVLTMWSVLTVCSVLLCVRLDYSVPEFVFSPNCSVLTVLAWLYDLSCLFHPNRSLMTVMSWLCVLSLLGLSDFMFFHKHKKAHSLSSIWALELFFALLPLCS